MWTCEAIWPLSSTFAPVLGVTESPPRAAEAPRRQEAFDLVPAEPGRARQVHGVSPQGVRIAPGERHGAVWKPVRSPQNWYRPKPQALWSLLHFSLCLLLCTTACR